MTTKPVIAVDGVRICRGYPVFGNVRRRVDFIGATDGPFIEISGSGEKMVLTLDLAKKLVTAIQQLAAAPSAAPGAHDTEIRAMGFQPLAVAGGRTAA